MPTLQMIATQYKRLQQRTLKATNEEEVRLSWVRALENTLGITFHAERDKQDLSYNNVVIEFKALGKFNGKIASPAFREAIDERLLPYILHSAKRDHIDESDYIGIAIDGKHLAFAQVIDGSIHHQHLLPVTEVTFGMVVEARSPTYCARLRKLLLPRTGHSEGTDCPRIDRSFSSDGFSLLHTEFHSIRLNTASRRHRRVKIDLRRGLRIERDSWVYRSRFT